MNVNRFLEIEQKYNLFDLQVNGVHYWTYHRTSIWNFGICIQQYGMQAKGKSAGKSKAFWLREAMIPLHIPQRTDILFLNHSRRIKVGEYYDSIYTEDLAGLYQYSTAIEDSPHHRDTEIKVRTNHQLHIGWIRKRNRILTKLYNKTHRKKIHEIYQETAKQILPALTEISEAYQWPFDEHEIISGFVYTIVYNRIAKHFYRALLKKIHPHLIVEVVSYNRNRMIINETAKELGIPTIELQHGNIFDNHLAYQYRTKEQIPQFPDYVMLFSDFWKARINAPIQDDHLISVGFPHFEKMREMARNRAQNVPNRRYTILFVSQETIGAELSEYAVALSKILPPDDYHIVYKLHPSECKHLNTKYCSLRDSDIEVIGESTENIYDLFCRCDMQVGVYSTAIYEGIGFGLYTLIVTIGMYDAMEPLVQAGLAHYAGSPDEIANRAKEKPVLQKEDADKLWTPNALQNMKYHIDKILEQQKAGHVNGLPAFHHNSPL